MNDFRGQVDSCVNTNTSMRNKEYFPCDYVTFSMYRSLIYLSVFPSILLSACISVAYTGRSYVKFGTGD